MIRIEFIKHQGGVVNIVNGNLKDTDRNTLLNIEAIDRVIVDSSDAIAINNALNAIEIAGYIIVFDSLSSMQIYLDQIDLMDGETFNPGVEGIRKPTWDVASRDKRDGIQPHTYTYTDIERQMISGE